jgi:homopolymeric O-antigen transport system ATP-binding protein
MNNRAIVVEQLSKRYEIGKLSRRHDTLRDSLVETFASPFHKVALLMGRNGLNGTAASESSTFWALQNISFEVQRGEVVGIIGHNGAGKSTLLKILSRITDPTCGFAEIDGRVSALLEVGTGFHHDLSGRENIYLSGAILGMKRAQINHNFDKIVEFSEVEKFIDTPVKHYSSGMYLRLAFAVAAHLDPEILLIDEVLAVGDAAFQRKCLGKMEDVSKAGRTVLFVSHNMGAVRNLCSRAILLNQGRIQASGATQDVIQEYLSMVYTDQASDTLGERQDRSGNGNVRAVSFQVSARGNNGTQPRSNVGADFVVGYAAHGEQPISTLYVGIGVTDILGTGVFFVSTSMNDSNFHSVSPSGQIVCQIDRLPLVPGRYGVHIKLMDNHGLADSVRFAASFDVIDSGEVGFSRYIRNHENGSILVPHTWTLR